jgi:hypothetical protein
VPVAAHGPDPGTRPGVGPLERGAPLPTDSERVEVDVWISAPADRVWALVTDVDLPGRFSREFQGGEWLDEPGEGARFRGHNKIGEFEWSTTCTVVDFRPGAAFSWAVESVDEPVAVWGYTMEDRDGAVLLGMHATMGPAPSPPAARPRPTPSTPRRSSPAACGTGRRT